MPILIEGMSPEDYASLWGCDASGDTAPNLPGDGSMFYNYGSENQAYTTEYLASFLAAIDRTIEKAQGWLKSVNAETPQNSNRRLERMAYEEDLRNLPILREHVAAELALLSR